MASAASSHLAEALVLRLSVPLGADLAVPPDATSLIIFAHGSGSSRHSPRNQWVAARLQATGVATLLVDLLTPEEDRDPRLRFDVGKLGGRVAEVCEWAVSHAPTLGFRIGLFGASTGSAAALIAAAAHPDLVRAVVSRGGRPDLAMPILPRVLAPTRLIVGALDRDVVGMNQRALERLGAQTKDLVIVPGASHLFEEPGTLARVSELAIDWFSRFVAANPSVPLDDEC